MKERIKGISNLIGIEPVKEGFLSTDVELISVRSLNRVCEICGADPK